MDRLEIKEILAQAELFKGLEEGDIERLVDLCSEMSYTAGAYPFRQGDLGDNIYVIAEGQICLERTRDLGERSAKVVVASLGKGKVFGCWSTLLGEAHYLLCSALCSKATRILVLNGADLRKEMLGNTKLGCRVLERLCFLLRERLHGVYGAMEKI